MDSVQSVASSSSSTAPSSQPTSHFISQTEIEMESSKARHWSQLDYSTTDSEMSAESNSKHFALLKEDPQWGRFFADFKTLEVGGKISGGAQADIYEARNTCDGPFDLVVKVMKGDVPLKSFQAQWPIGMLSARSKYKHLFDLPLITILGGTVLRDERLRGRFAFVMYRRWGDLRVLIDRRMKQERTTRGPFPIDEAIHLMLTIAEDMDTLHNKHDIIHRDLKASNVLVWGNSGEDLSCIGTPNGVEKIGSVVADFECSVGVMGTSFWRAPEIREQSRVRVPHSKVQFTHASDVYSYGMTCYEILTGCIPYGGLGSEDTISQILRGQHQEFPHELAEGVRNIIISCWHSDPLMRPTFSDICLALKLKRGPNLKKGHNPKSVTIDNKVERDASIVKVEQWNNPQSLTLLEVISKLLNMDLKVLKATTSSSIELIIQYFEVTNSEGKKLVKDKSIIANITEALSLPVEMKWISESLGTSINGNTAVQMHVIEVIMWSARLLEALSRLLVMTNFRVHSARRKADKSPVQWIIYVEGANTSTLLWELQHDMKYFRISPYLFKMTMRKVAVEELSYLSRLPHSLKSMHLTLPCSSSNNLVPQIMESEEGFRLTKVVLCLQQSKPQVHKSGSLADMDYKTRQAVFKYPGSYEFPKDRSNKIELIKNRYKTPSHEEKGNTEKVVDVAIERECLEVKMELGGIGPIIGPSKELHDDLVKSLRDNGLYVTSDPIYYDYWGNGYFYYSKSGFYFESLDFFVTEYLATEAT